MVGGERCAIDSKFVRGWQRAGVAERERPSLKGRQMTLNAPSTSSDIWWCVSSKTTTKCWSAIRMRRQVDGEFLEPVLDDQPLKRSKVLDISVTRMTPCTFATAAI